MNEPSEEYRKYFRCNLRIERCKNLTVDHPKIAHPHGELCDELRAERARREKAEATVREQERKIEELKENIREYGSHNPGCNAPFGSYKCKCGFEELLNEI